MRFLSASLLLVGSLFIASSGQAYVLIDDFTVGDYHSVIVWPNKHDTHRLTGLDTNHSVFGNRGADVLVNSNFDKVPVNIDIGSAQARVSYNSPSGDIATDTILEFGDFGGPIVDFSQEKEIWVDLFTEDPARRFADQWSITIVDGDGHIDTNPAWLSRQGGIYFRRQDFNPQVDWAKIRTINFRQKFTPDIGDVPSAYVVTKIYAVPEPSTAAFAAAGLLLARRKAAASPYFSQVRHAV